MSFVPVSGGVASRQSVQTSGAVIDNALGAPANVLTRNAGTGTMEVRWDAATGIVDHYDIYISTSASGSYDKANQRPIRATFAKIASIPFGLKIYTKVRAVGKDGAVGAFSAVALDAVASRATIVLRCTGPLGDVVPQGVVFSAVVNDELIAFRTTQSGQI